MSSDEPLIASLIRCVDSPMRRVLCEAFDECAAERYGINVPAPPPVPEVGDILSLSSPGAKDELASQLADALGELAELKQRNRELEDQAKGAKDALWEADAMLQLGLVPPPRIGHMVGARRIGHVVGALDVTPANVAVPTDAAAATPHAPEQQDASPIALAPALDTDLLYRLPTRRVRLGGDGGGGRDGGDIAKKTLRFVSKRSSHSSQAIIPDR